MGKGVGFVITSERGEMEPIILVCSQKRVQKPAPEETAAQTQDKMINSYKLHIVLCECFIKRNQRFWTGFIHKTILQRMDTLPLLPSHDNKVYLEGQSFPQRHNLRSTCWLSRLVSSSAMIFPREAKDGLRIKNIILVCRKVWNTLLYSCHRKYALTFEWILASKSEFETARI